MAPEAGFIEAVSEQDIDFLLMEELRVNDALYHRLVSRTGAWLQDVWQTPECASLGDRCAAGETDMRFIFATALGEEVALLMETR